MAENYSVLMSVYYKEKPEYLREAINSILNQSVQTNDFVIVCDGPLNQGLDKVIAEYVRTNPGLFNVYRLDHNMGLARALNNGILQCKNELIARMDSDDISASDRMKKQLQIFKQKKVDIVGSNLVEFAGSVSNTQNMRSVPENNDDIMEFAKKRNPFNHPTVMFRKSVVIDAGFYEDYRYFEDYNLWTTMLSKGYVGYNIQEILLYMRAGQDMYKRRGGMNYVKCIFKFKRHLCRTGFISIGTFLWSSTGHSIISMIPNGLRTKVYAKALRKKDKS